MRLKKIKIEDYFNKLLKADWFYHYSDCFETRERARNNIAMLKKISVCHPIARKMWNDCQEHVGKLQGNPYEKHFYCPKIHAEFSF